MDKHTVHCPNSTYKIIIECAALTKLRYDQDEEAWICAYSDWAYGLFAICGAVILLLPFLFILYCCFKCCHKNEKREINYDKLVESLSRSTSIIPESHRDVSFLPDMDSDLNREKQGSKDKYFYPYPAYGTDDNNSINNGGQLPRYPELTVAHQADMPPQCTTQNMLVNPSISDVTSRMSIPYLSSSDPVVTTMLRETQQKLYDSGRYENEEVSSSYPHRKSDDEINRDYSTDIHDDDKNMLLRHQYDNYMCKKVENEDEEVKTSNKNNVLSSENNIDMVDCKDKTSVQNYDVKNVQNEMKSPIETLNSEINLIGSLNNDDYVVEEPSSIPDETEEENSKLNEVDNSEICDNEKNELENEKENQDFIDSKNENDDLCENSELFNPDISEINPKTDHNIDEDSNESSEGEINGNIPDMKSEDNAPYMFASTPKNLTSKQDYDDFLLNCVSSMPDDEKNGTYLVRKSTTRNNCQVLHLHCSTVRSSSNIFYFTLCYNENGEVCIDNTEILFDSIDQLFSYYRSNRSILPCVLRNGVGIFP